MLAVMTLMVLPVGAQSRTFIYAHAQTDSEPFTTKYALILDMGQASKQSLSSNRLINEKGRPILFNSPMDALNSLGSQGWEVVTCAPDSTGYVEHYYLKKETTGMTKEEVKAFLSQYRIKNAAEPKVKGE